MFVLVQCPEMRHCVANDSQLRKSVLKDFAPLQTYPQTAGQNATLCKSGLGRNGATWGDWLSNPLCFRLSCVGTTHAKTQSRTVRHSTKGGVMSMSKKDFIALAEMIQWCNGGNTPQFTQEAIDNLAQFCSTRNPRFNRDRWLGYIAGTNGPNGGRVKHST